MVSCGNGKKKKKERIKRWIIKHPKLFAFFIALFIIVGVVLVKPEYVEPVSRAFVLLIGVAL